MDDERLEEVVKCLKNIMNGDASDNNSNSGASDSDTGFFCVEDAITVQNIDISINNIGPLSFPIQEEFIEQLIQKSEKAKFGKGLETVLDTTYRDTQTIPGNKLQVSIDHDVLDTLLQRIGQALNLGEDTKLELHLYNMLIYGPGQFFKRHRDTEKVKNMIATLIMVLPSPHKGGDLIIQHHSLKHRFFGASLSPEIIKCVAFYPDCYHEVKKVVEGYRVALTFNVELKSGALPDLLNIDEELKNAVNNYFEESDNDKLVYFLDHQYTEHSLKWHMLKGTDRICAKALWTVGKLEGYPPCLALAEYHESWPEGCEEDAEKDMDLYFWIDENNIRFHSENISVSEDELCYMKDTKEAFDPYKREEEGNMGNYAGNVDEWYHRSAVVLWRDNWVYVDGYKKEYQLMHQFIAEPDMQDVLLKKITDNSERFFSTKYWTDENIKKMILDIMIYLNDQEIASKILTKLKPSEVLNLDNNELLFWLSKNCSLETWKTCIAAWEKMKHSSKILQYLLSFLLNYITDDDKDLEIAGSLLDESARFFLNPESKNSQFIGNGYRLYIHTDLNDISEKNRQLCSLLQICFILDKLDTEKSLVKSSDLKSSVVHFKMFEDLLHPEQFARISSDLLSNMADAALEKIDKARPNKAYIDEVCTLLKLCGNLGHFDVEQKILDHLISKPHNYTILNSNVFKMFEEVLRPDKFASVSGDLLLSLTNAILEKIEKALSSKSYIEELCSLLKLCGKLEHFAVEQKILNHIISKPDNYAVLNCNIFRMLKEALRPDKFESVSGDLLLGLTNAVLSKIEKTSVDENGIQEICSLLKFCGELKHSAVEQKILNNIISYPGRYIIPNSNTLNMFKKALNPEQFAKISGPLLLSLANAFLSKIEINVNENKIQEICSLLKFCSELKQSAVEQKILNHIISYPDRYIIPNSNTLNMFKIALNPEHFAKISGPLLLSFTSSVLGKIEKASVNERNIQEISSLLKFCSELKQSAVEQKILNHIISYPVRYIIPHSNTLQMYEKALNPEQFAKISGTLLLNLSIIAVKKIQNEKYTYAVPNQTYIQEICNHLESCSRLGHTAVLQQIFNHIISNPSIRKPSFLADLYIKIQQVLKNYINHYEVLKNYTLNKIQAELEKSKNTNDWTLPINLSCNCEYCSKVQRFFISSVQMETIIPASQHYRDHMTSNLKLLANVLIRTETIREGSPHKLRITKLPKLLQDRQNYFTRLLQARDMILQTSSMEPAVKKIKCENENENEVIVIS